MRRTTLTVPELCLIAVTRGLMGAGVGLLLAERLPKERRRAIGWPLVLIGALSTVPLIIDVVSNSSPSSQSADSTSQRSPGASIHIL